ncbi:MAG: ABC transporter ATP-binding protein [Rhizobiaceae bacterium]|nr:ABC transporter ATP-binding protein [Rhizobiaceae bacterium]
MLIEALKISKRFGGLQAIDNVTVRVRSGEVTSVIGPNGAGKTTLLNCLTGVIAFDGGEVRIDGKSYGTFAPQDLVEIGIARTFQNIRLWESLTVEEHIVLARRNYFNSRRGRKAGKEGQLDITVDGLLARVGLTQKAKLKPLELSYGERRRLELARALATSPILILLDEPAAGFNLSEQMMLADHISEIAASGVAVILVEHHMDLVARVSNNVVVINFGKELATGSIAEIRSNPSVVAAYLGTTS